MKISVLFNHIVDSFSAIKWIIQKCMLYTSANTTNCRHDLLQYTSIYLILPEKPTFKYICIYYLYFKFKMSPFN